jgi:hypothetical protein
MLKRCAWIALAVIVIVVVATFLRAFSTGRITPAMIEDRGYYRWTRACGEFRGNYLETFKHDYRFHQQFIRKPIDSLRPLVPSLHSGAAYSSGSYRATNVRSLFPRYIGTRFEDYWLDGAQDDFGFCVLVVDGKVRDFFWVKG